MRIKKERRYWYGMLLKYVCGLQKCDYAFSCQKLFISRADPKVFPKKCDGLFSKYWQKNKFTLMCFKDR